MKRQIIIRADDLGYSEAINYGILKTIEYGQMNNIGFMVNMPASIHGYNLIKEKDICLGLHTNICVGKPLTNPSFIPSLVDENGMFKSSKTYRSAKSDFVILEEVMLEIDAQYKRFVEITGKRPDYFEGHAVASENFFNGLENVAKKYGLLYSGMDFANGYVFVNGHKLYMNMDSMLPDYNPISFIKKVLSYNRFDNVEVLIFHPGYIDQFILEHSSLIFPRIKEVDAICSVEFGDLISSHNVSLLRYDDLI